jgi:copper(I)-binding protein
MIMKNLKKNIGLLIIVWSVFGCNEMSVSSVQVKNAWVREPPGGHPITGAYMEIVNRSSVICEIIGVSSEKVGRVEIHSMEYDDEMMRMRKVDSLMLRPEEEINLQPGGLHLMLMDIADVLKAGDSLPLMLHFSDGTKQLVESSVRKGPHE